MSGPTWRIDDEDGDPELTGTPRPLVVTLGDLADALARTWRTWVGATCLGALLGLGLLAALPRPVSATTTLLMVAPNPDDPSAMDTDASLLLTRAVAERVISDLDLRETPQALLATVTATPVSSQVMTVTVEAPDEAAARARARSLVTNFLQFRAEQLRSVSDGLVTGYEKRIASLQERVDTLTREYDRLAAGRVVDQVRLSDITNERAALTTQVTELQRAIEDAALAADAAVSATHVLDEPAASTPGSRRRAVLVAVSGAIVVGALAVGTILFRALTSVRLRRRRDIAAALGVPVLVGVPSLRLPRRWSRPTTALTTGIARILRGRPQRWSEPLRHRTLDALVEGVATALPRPLGSGSGPAASDGGPSTLGVVAIDRVRAAAVVLRALAHRLAAEGTRVLLVDLTTSAALAGHHASGAPTGDDEGKGAPSVVRPEGDPALTPGPRRGGRRGRVADGGVLGTWTQFDVVLVLLEVDPGLDLDLLPTWVDRIVPFVTAGRPSHELLTTVAGLLSGSGVGLPFAVLEGADRRDRSSGRPAGQSGPVGEPASDEGRSRSHELDVGVRVVQTR
ncbi:hypothetical protein Q9R29_05145 [Rothia sp. ARF10]|nr:hypothetical protein [Rothia sp. ARF10]